MTLPALSGEIEEQLVLDVLDAGGDRGASHEDFVEAGLAADYVGILHRLVDEDRLQVRIDFTTGQARWVVESARGVRAA